MHLFSTTFVVERYRLYGIIESGATQAPYSTIPYRRYLSTTKVVENKWI